MTVPLWVALALAIIVLIASLRIARRSTRLPLPRRLVMLGLQALTAVLLYFTLVPPERTVDAGPLTVLTGNAALVGPVPAGATVIALPEANARADIPRAPDLATALRQHPGSTALRLIGDGLPARDRDTALPPGTTLQAAPAPRGWVDLQPPDATAPGALFTVTARANGVPAGRAELLDPAGTVIDRAVLDAQGRVRLHGSARAVGRSEFTLRLLDAQLHVVDALPVPQQTVAAAAPRVLIVAGAPGPELKYLRRWAADTGLEVQAQASAGGGVMLGDTPVVLTAARLDATDVLVLDERSLASLDSAQRARVHQALREGLGLLVRTTGPLGEGARQALRGWGLAVSGGGRTAPLALPADPDPALLQARRGPQRPAAEGTPYIEDADTVSHAAAPPALERIDLTVADADALLRDANGQPTGGWRTVGRGRLGILPVTDSYRLVLAGRGDRHAELWSSVFSTVARPLSGASTVRPESTTPWSGERVSLCGVAEGSRILDVDGSTIPLTVDPATGSRRCAGYWPQQAGWHQLQHGEVVQALYVFDPAAAPTLHRQHVRDATTRHLAVSVDVSTGAPVKMPGPRWPWLLAFIAVAGLLWWLERRCLPRSD